MGESSGLQSLDRLLEAELKAKLNEGLAQASALHKLLSSDIGLDFTEIVSGYLDKIVIAFGAARGLISVNSSASNFEDHANTLAKRLGGIDLGHFRKHVKNNRNSCFQSPKGSARPRSRSPSRMDYGSPSKVFEGSVKGKGKQKCHEFSDENECFGMEKEQTISRKGKREMEREVSRRGRRVSTPTETRYVPANRSEAGNDILIEDGHTWHKYGHKKLRGDDHPKMYYKCTFHKERGCEALRTAQRLNGDPSCFEVKYTGFHSCQRHRQFIENPFPNSDIQAYGGGFISNVDSMAFTGHSADQMYRFEGSEKEVSADFISSPHQNEGPSNCQDSLPPCGLSSASEANYMPPTNPRMQTTNPWLELLESLGTEFSSTSDAEFWAPKEIGMPPTNPPRQTMDTSESDIAAVVSRTNSASL